MNTKPKNRTKYRLELIPDPPPQLSDAAQCYWDKLLPTIFELGTARLADVQSIALLCGLLVEIDQLQATLTKDGYSVESAAGTKKSHPAAACLDSARNRANSLMDDFGLLPRSYARQKPQYRPDYDD